jgi:predicted RNase H-like HicB family nuclease
VPKKYREVRAEEQRYGPSRHPGQHPQGQRLGAAEMSEYVVVFERAEDGGWGAYLPDLPGVVALGVSREEVAARIREAVRVYSEEMAALGRPFPEPVASTETIQAA